MELILFSNGKLSGDSQLLGYGKAQLDEMIKRRNVKSAVLIPYAVIRSSHEERVKELKSVLGIDVKSINDFADPV